MIRLIPLVLLALAACDSPFEEAWPRHTMTIDRGEEAYQVRAQFDPFERAWFARIWLVDRPIARDEGPEVVALFEQEVGPRLCDGAPIALKQGMVWTGDSPRVNYLADLGHWQLVGSCT